MIDTHCHLISGVDDGPADEAESIELARRLVADGVSSVVCTPHYSHGFPYPHERAAERHASLAEALETQAIALRTTLAAEVHPALAVSAPIEELRTRSIAGRYVLVEVLADSPGPFFASAVTRLGEAGLVPIFGHPERSRAVQRHIGALDAARRDGALVQIVAPSLLGRWGHGARVAAWRLVDTGRADLLASDAHGVRRRRPHLGEAAGLIAERLSPSVVAELTERKPAAVLGEPAEEA